MNETFVEAIILGANDLGEADKLIHFYSKELGLFSAKAKSIRKITSKLAGQLEPLSFVKARVIGKSGFQVIDALCFSKIKICAETVIFADFLKEMIPELEPDEKIWELSLNGFNEAELGKTNFLPLISAMGFDPEFAECSSCAGKEVSFFSKTQHIFLCDPCAFNSSLSIKYQTSEDLIKIN